MGAWNATIFGNDTSLVVKEEFIISTRTISKELISLCYYIDYGLYLLNHMNECKNVGKNDII